MNCYMMESSTTFPDHRYVSRGTQVGPIYSGNMMGAFGPASSPFGPMWPGMFSMGSPGGNSSTQTLRASMKPTIAFPVSDHQGPSVEIVPQFRGSHWGEYPMVMGSGNSCGATISNNLCSSHGRMDAATDCGCDRHERMGGCSDGRSAGRSCGGATHCHHHHHCNHRFKSFFHHSHGCNESHSPCNIGFHHCYGR